MFAIPRRVLSKFSGLRCFANFVEPKEIQVKVPWGHIAIKQWGELTQPLVLCFHGYLDNAGVFDKLIPILPNRFCYLAMDLPGHGLSSMANDCFVYTDDLYNESMSRVLRHFDNKITGFIGHSMGSGVCVRYNVIHPAAVSFIICMELPVLPHNLMEERIRHVGRRIDKVMKQFTIRHKEPARTKEELLRAMIFGWGGSIDREAAEILFKRGAKQVGDKWKMTRDLACGNNQILGVYEFSYTAFDLPRQSCNWSPCFPETMRIFPDLNFCGIEFSEGLRFHTSEMLEKTFQVLSKTLKSVEYHAIRGKHHLLLTHPHKVSGIITEFMDRVAP